MIQLLTAAPKRLYAAWALAATLALGLAWVKKENAQEAVFALEADLARMEATYAEKARASESRERSKEQAWQDQLLENQRNYEKRMQQLAVDASSADRAARGLREQLATFANAASASCASASTTEGGAAATDPYRVLAELSSQIDHYAEVLAKHADTSRAAGLLCESSYDSLTR